jgi:uncharacterized protein YndB with AHSA1/START domain
MSAPALRLVRVLPAPPEEIFDAWTDAASLAVWMAPGSVSRSLVELDAREGGRFRIVMKGPDCDHVHEGEYLVVDRPRRLVFTWVSAATGGRATTVTVELVPRGSGKTELTLTHEGLPDEAARERHGSGWGDILRKLGASVPEARQDEPDSRGRGGKP